MLSWLRRVVIVERARADRPICWRRSSVSVSVESRFSRRAASANGSGGRGADAVVAAGGDGTISTVAAGLVDTQVPLGVIPLGTFNHFARDIGVTPTLEQAVQIIAAGHVRRIDVGEVNSHVFINNAFDRRVPGDGARPLAGADEIRPF